MIYWFRVFIYCERLKDASIYKHKSLFSSIDFQNTVAIVALEPLCAVFHSHIVIQTIALLINSAWLLSISCHGNAVSIDFHRAANWRIVRRSVLIADRPSIGSYRIPCVGRAPILVTRPLWTDWVKDRSSRLTVGFDSADVNSLCNSRHQLNCDVAVAVDL